jgi:hypothetical protein
MTWTSQEINYKIDKSVVASCCRPMVFCCNLGTKEVRILMLGLDNAGKTSNLKIGIEAAVIEIIYLSVFSLPFFYNQKTQ